MKEGRRQKKDLGSEPALVADGRRQPDRRQISSRWLIGTFLTGVTSCTLMGIALFAALDGREQLATPPELLGQNDLPILDDDSSDDGKSDRVAMTLPRQVFDDRRRFELSTMQKVGEKEVIRSQPFEMVRMGLAEERPSNLKYPKFNALNIFAETPTLTANENNAQIYGAKVESEITLRNIDFPAKGVKFEDSDVLSAEQAEQIVRSTGMGLSNDAAQVAVLRYMDPIQFGSFNSSFSFSNTPDVKIVQENVSVSPRETGDDGSEGYAEDIIPFRKKEKILKALNDANYQGQDAENIAEALASYNKSDTLEAGSVLRIGIEAKAEGNDRIVRASIYNGMRHILSVAMNDQGQYVSSAEPEMTPVLKTAFEGGVPTVRVASSNLPTVYDAIYKAALSYDLNTDMVRQLIKMLASDIDLQSHISINDSLDVFYPLNDENENTADKAKDREILYVSATFGDITRKYYRFQSKDGTVDYYDSDGRSSKQFLIRKPVPNGIFRSPFGGRRHPILGYVRMHTGVDWAAPRGSPIIAAGDGVVIKAGTMRGYGNHTEIQHANGYVSSYSHQQGFAKGIKEGARVRQGQVIGYVGSTGLSTGPHCHFEVIVNGTKVDPMRIRLPDSKALKGKELEAFKRDRNRIDSLISGQDSTKMAATSLPSTN